MARDVGGPPEVLSTPAVILRARGAAADPDGSGLSWSDGPLPVAGAAEDVVRIDLVGDEVHLCGTDSGAVPLYVDPTDDGVRLSSHLDVLIRTRPAPVAPDWDGLAAMVAASGPLDGRTTVAGIRRLRPGERLVWTPGSGSRVSTDWSWPQIAPGVGKSADLAEALHATLGRLTASGPVLSLLSGGWDSRLLLALAVGTGGSVQALTTSSDTGTVMEELVAAQVAEHLEIPHRIVIPQRAQFGADLADFATAVDYQTAFHIWLVPLARAVLTRRGQEPAQTPPTVLDGLGGGLFIGSSFSDQTAGSVTEQRLAELGKYLPALEQVVHPAVARRLTDRVRAGGEATVQRYLDHPYGHILTAYLTRTVPGISLAPHGLMARTGPVATPFLSPDVVAAALRLPPAEHANDRLYPQLLEAVDPALAQLTTAQRQVPWPRPHPRRITSIEAIRRLRSLLLREPVRSLLAPTLLEGAPRDWRRLLASTGGQHLIRGLAMLSLWQETYADLVTDFDLRELGG